MKKLKLLLLDADVIIGLFELGLWNHVVERCEVLIAQTIWEEVDFFENPDTGLRETIDLDPDRKNGNIRVVEVFANDLKKFSNLFNPSYLERLHKEIESLAFLCCSKEPCLISSGDKIVYRVLGRLDLGDRGISLEEVLGNIGLTKKLDQQFTKDYRIEWTKKGTADKIQGIGLKP